MNETNWPHTGRMILNVFLVHMGRYGLRFCENGSYIKYLAIGINVGPISAGD